MSTALSETPSRQPAETSNREPVVHVLGVNHYYGEGEARRQVLLTFGPEAVEGAALECSSVLAQALANRWGVVPTNILEDF